VLVDDGLAERVRVSGTWESPAVSGRYGPTLRRGSAGAGGAVRFLPEITTAGTYRVYLYWPRSGALATNVPVEIRHAGGTQRVTLNQRTSTQTAQGGIALWTFVAELRFEPGTESWLEIGTAGVDGDVLADAALFVPVATSR